MNQGRRAHGGLGAVAALALSILLLASLPASALAAGLPIVSETSFSEVTPTSATLEATLDPNGKKTTYRFQYITEAEWLKGGEQFAPADTHETPGGEIAEELGAEHPVSATISGLAPATAYRFRLFAHNGSGDTTGEELAFATYPAAPTFGPCPNDAFRSGQYAPPGAPSALLPDCRAYEQATPTDKDGGDVRATIPFAKTSPDGRSITYSTTFALPGGLGAQDFPLFRADRNEAGWSATGLLPPGGEAQRALIKGWLPDLSQFFVQVSRFGTPQTFALRATGSGGPSRQLTPFAPGFWNSDYYAGASADASQILLEHAGNVYVMDRAGATLARASTLNTEAQTASALPKGAFAGPYDWVEGKTTQGGASRGYYLQDQRAVAADGSAFFTAAGTGRLFLRLHSSEPQSALDGNEECTEAAKACTLELSSSHRSTPDPAGRAPAAFQAASADGRTAFFTSAEKLTDDANTGPEVQAPVIGRATLQGEGAAADVLPAFLAGAHAVGIAIDPAGKYVYWADPADGWIGRATLDGSVFEPSFIEPGETCFETHPKSEPGVSNCAPSHPRYVAVANGHVYWTNTGPLGGDKDGQQLEDPLTGAGTVGRATLNPTTEEAEEVDPEFITGASDPQGIAANSEHVYWANSLYLPYTHEDDIARAGIEGEAVEQHFFELNGGGEKPYGVALDASHVYFIFEGVAGAAGGAEVVRVPLEGGSEEFIGIAESAPRGIALDATHAYWVSQGTGEIGRLPLASFKPGHNVCEELPACDPGFLEPGGSLNGLATDPAAEHLFWSSNGEIPANPGNDLYRFQAPGSGGCSEAAGCLTDIVADPGEEDGADVLGVLGASEDGSRLYFVANGVLAANVVENGAGPECAEPGNCDNDFADNPKGRCSLYLWEADGSAAGEVGFIARLDAGGLPQTRDFLDWTARRLVTGERQSRLTPSGDALLFRSHRRLTAYDNQGVSEFYLYRPGQPLTCPTCNPTGAPPIPVPTGFGQNSLGSIGFSALEPTDPAMTTSRNLSADGRRAFFETTEALVAADLDGDGGCPKVGGPNSKSPPACLDVYEWEAPGAGSCEEGAPAFSPANGGCLYLLSDGSEAEPSFFGDASASGDHAFIFTRSQLVGQDSDDLQDVYDVGAGGGLASQNPQLAPVCGSAEACRPGATPAPEQSPPVTPGFQGTGNLAKAPPRKCPKGKVRHHGHCVKKAKKHHRKRHHQRRNRR